MLSNKKLLQTVTELLIRGRILLFYYAEQYSVLILTSMNQTVHHQ